MKNIKIYLKLIFIISLINLPIGTIGTFFGVRDYAIYFILISGLILDSVFLLTFIKNIKINTYEFILLSLIIISIFIGLINNEVSRSFFTDFINPTYFILKTSLFRHLFLNHEIRNFIKRNIVLASKYLLGFSIFTIMLFFILDRYVDFYVGTGVTTHPYLISVLLSTSIYQIIFVLIVVVLSGKRALLLSSIIIIIYTQIKIIKKVPIKFLLITTLVSFLIYNYISTDFDKYASLGKYIWTIEKLVETDVEYNLDNQVINLASAGRLGEIKAVVDQMNFVDFIIGKGTGFKYDYENLRGEFMSNYSNVHFTPLGLISKYGFLFFILLSYYILKNLKNITSYGYLNIFFGLYLIGLLIDMIFAYAIFVDPFIPIALGYLSISKNNKRTNFILPNIK